MPDLKKIKQYTVLYVVTIFYILNAIMLFSKFGFEIRIAIVL